MKLSDLCIPATEIIPVVHPDHGETELKVELHHPLSRGYNAALARMIADGLDKELPLAVLVAEAAFIQFHGEDSGAGVEILRDERFFWLAVSVYNHINKKKVTSAPASNS